MKCESVQEYKLKLTELHDGIKENPFRTGNMEYWSCGRGYFAALDAFADTFYHLTKDIQTGVLPDISEKDRMLAKVAEHGTFTHDFFAAVNTSDNARIAYDLQEDPQMLFILHKEESMLELCIVCIHTYLDTGLFLRYPHHTKEGIQWMAWEKELDDYQKEQDL